jgi:hypothetical protein
VLQLRHVLGVEQGGKYDEDGRNADRAACNCAQLDGQQALAPDNDEGQLLDDFVRGLRSMDEVEELLNWRLKLTI